jgi:metal-dependent amidase/aminoacylase/carboxypeptidase family protein
MHKVQSRSSHSVDRVYAKTAPNRASCRRSWIAFGPLPPDLTAFEEFYRELHHHPELPTQELCTSLLVARKLRDLGFLEVFEDIGGHGIVAMFRNGPGKTVLIRADLDALPIREETGLPYASKVEMKDSWGVERPVMHACAHDMHAAFLLAASSLLLAAKEHWSGDTSRPLPT